MAFEAYLFLTGLPVAAVIAWMYFTHRDGTVTDTTTGKAYSINKLGQYEPLVVVSHGSGHHQEEQIEATGTCPTCGIHIGDAHHFCPGCGKRLQ